MTRREAESHATYHGGTVDCVRTKYGRNKRKVEYSYTTKQGDKFVSAIGWQDVFDKAGIPFWCTCKNGHECEGHRC